MSGSHECSKLCCSDVVHAVRTYFEEVGEAPGSYGGMDESTRNVYQNRASEDQNGHDHHHHVPHLHHKKGDRDLSWHREHYAFDRKKGYPSTLGPVSNPDGTGVCLDKTVHKHHHGFFCHHKNSKALHRGTTAKSGQTDKEGGQGEEGNNDNQMQGEGIADKGNESRSEASGLRIRMWLESRRKEEKGRQFASYECVVPDLVALPNGAKV